MPPLAGSWRLVVGLVVGVDVDAMVREGDQVRASGAPYRDFGLI